MKKKVIYIRIVISVCSVLLAIIITGIGAIIFGDGQDLSPVLKFINNMMIVIMLLLMFGVPVLTFKLKIFDKLITKNDKSYIEERNGFQQFLYFKTLHKAKKGNLKEVLSMFDLSFKDTDFIFRILLNANKYINYSDGEFIDEIDLKSYMYNEDGIDKAKNIYKFLYAIGFIEQENDFPYRTFLTTCGDEAIEYLANSSEYMINPFPKKEIDISAYIKEKTIEKESISLDNLSNDGRDFEYFVADLLVKLGYNDVEVTKGSGDQGVDVIAMKDQTKYVIQCKYYSSKLGNSSVQEIVAGRVHYNAHVGIVATNNYFTPGAIELANSNNVILWDRDKMSEMLATITNYERGGIK